MVLDSYFISYSITGISKILVFQYAAMSLDILRMLEDRTSRTLREKIPKQKGEQSAKERFSLHLKIVS
jgi:hypothetical protein